MKSGSLKKPVYLRYYLSIKSKSYNGPIYITVLNGQNVFGSFNLFYRIWNLAIKCKKSQLNKN